MAGPILVRHPSGAAVSASEKGLRILDLSPLRERTIDEVVEHLDALPEGCGFLVERHAASFHILRILDASCLDFSESGVIERLAGARVLDQASRKLAKSDGGRSECNSMSAENRFGHFILFSGSRGGAEKTVAPADPGDNGNRGAA